MQYDVRTYTFNVEGFYPIMFKIQAMHLAEGQFFERRGRRWPRRASPSSAQKPRLKLFSGHYALGQYIRVDGISFKVIGVLAPRMQEGDDGVNRVI